MRKILITSALPYANGSIHLGHLVEWGDAAALLNTPRHPYTQALIASVPEISTSQNPPTLLKGEAVLKNTQNSCPFYPRCQQAQAICETESPPIQTVAPNHHFSCHFGDFPR